MIYYVFVNVFEDSRGDGGEEYWKLKEDENRGDVWRLCLGWGYELNQTLLCLCLTLFFFAILKINWIRGIRGLQTRDTSWAWHGKKNMAKAWWHDGNQWETNKSELPPSNNREKDVWKSPSNTLDYNTHRIKPREFSHDERLELGHTVENVDDETALLGRCFPAIK